MVIDDAMSSMRNTGDTSGSEDLESPLAAIMTDFLLATTMGTYTTAMDPNSTYNGTDADDSGEQDISEKPLVRAIFITLYSAIFLLGVSGNFLVVYVITRNKSMQTITNIFITNLALSDIMMCLLAVPFTPLSAFINSWVFGEALCHIVPMALGVSVYVSTLTSAAIAIDRYFVIVHPFRPRMKVFVCLLLIVAIWIISVSISLPLAIYQKVFRRHELQVYECLEHWPKKTARQFFTVTNLILQYIVPCSIISFCYTKVSQVLKTRTKKKIGTVSKNREREELELKRKRRTNKMLIAMVSIFVCCWMPLNTVLICTEYNVELDRGKYFVLLFFIAHVVAMSSTIYNPFLYAWMNDNFKKEFKQVVPFLFSRRRHSSMNGLTTQYTTVHTQSLINRSQSQTHSQRAPHVHQDNGKSIAEPTAVYDTGSEKVHLKVDGDEKCRK